MFAMISYYVLHKWPPTNTKSVMVRRMLLQLNRAVPVNTGERGSYKMRAHTGIVRFMLLLFSVSASVNAFAFEEADLNQLTSSNRCPQCNLRGANLNWMDLQGANLSQADLRGAQCVQTNLRNANLSGANLQGANMLAASLEGAVLHGVNFTAANLRAANLRGTDLRRINFRAAVLVGTNFAGADLSEADLRDAWLYDAELSGANLSRADLSTTKVTYHELDDGILCNTLTLWGELSLGCPAY